MSPRSAASFIMSPSRKSTARTLALSSRVLNTCFGSFNSAPFGNVSRDRALECLTDADVPIARPHGNAHRPGRLFPFHLLDDGCVGAEDHRSQSCKRRAPPVAGCLDDGIDGARRRRIWAWTARARCHSWLTSRGPLGSLTAYAGWIIAD